MPGRRHGRRALPANSAAKLAAAAISGLLPRLPLPAFRQFRRKSLVLGDLPLRLGVFPGDEGGFRRNSERFPVLLRRHLVAYGDVLFQRGESLSADKTNDLVGAKRLVYRNGRL